MSPAEAARRLARFRAGRPRLIETTLRDALIYGMRRAVTFYMEPLGRNPIGRGVNAVPGRPANPPPGPLGIRTGNLRRAVQILKPQKRGEDWQGGLKYDVARAPYAPAHEFGARTSAHEIWPVNKKALRWWDGAGSPVFARHVMHPGSVIPPRPVLTPATRDAADFFYAELERRTERLARSVLP